MIYWFSLGRNGSRFLLIQVCWPYRLVVPSLCLYWHLPLFNNPELCEVSHLPCLYVKWKIVPQTFSCTLKQVDPLFQQLLVACQLLHCLLRILACKIF